MIRKLKENCFAWVDTLALSAKERAPVHCCRGVLVGSALMPSGEEEGPDGIAYISDSLNLSPMLLSLRLSAGSGLVLLRHKK